MIETKNLCYVTKNGKQILNNISLRFESGKISVVTGANGSGKSTLIKLLMGTLSPTSGQIFLDGKDVSSWSATERANAGITLAMQQPVAFKGISVKRLMEIAGKSSLSVGETCAYLSQVGLCAKDYVNRNFCSDLSGGEMKRIELALALAKGGNVFLFDEPEAGIDLWSFESLIEIFKSLKGKTVIIVSHQKKILDIADNIVLFDSNGNATMGKRKKMQDKIQNKTCKALGGAK